MAETVLEVDSVDTALAIFGNCDENIRLLEQAFGVTAICRGTEVKLTGGEEDVERARRALDAMLMLRQAVRRWKNRRCVTALAGPAAGMKRA